MAVVLAFLRVGIGLAALGLAGLALAARLGVIVPTLDLLNHFQVLLILGLLATLLLSLVVFIGSGWMPLAVSLSVIGLAASAVAVGPETWAALQPRAPLPADGRPVIKLFSNNVFGLNYDMKRVARVIAAEAPDIVALQEYFPEQRGPLDPLLKPDYPYSAYCVGGRRANLAIYSKIPFVQVQDGDCTTDPGSTRRTAHILARFAPASGGPFSVLVTHLEWPVPPSRLEAQLPVLQPAIRNAPDPLLVVGDFNSTPWSHFQQQFAADLGLTRQTHGTLTFPARFWIKGWRDTWPFLPLDQVMTRGAISVHALRTGARDGSDHLPLVTVFSVGDPEKLTPG